MLKITKYILFSWVHLSFFFICLFVYLFEGQIMCYWGILLILCSLITPTTVWGTRLSAGLISKSGSTVCKASVCLNHCIHHPDSLYLFLIESTSGWTLFIALFVVFWDIADMRSDNIHTSAIHRSRHVYTLFMM